MHEEGNTISFESFQIFLDEQFPEHHLNVKEHFIPRMKDLIIDTILSVKTQLNPNKRKGIFELFGYDFLIDEDFRLWLIEVNTNPYLGVPNSFIAGLLPKMMDDLMQLSVDPILPPQNIPESNNCELLIIQIVKHQMILSFYIQMAINHLKALQQQDM